METPQQRFLSRLAVLAKVCGATLSEDIVALYDRGLRRVGYDVVSTAIEKAVLERRSRDPMPSIADLASIACPVERDEDAAVEAAGRILTAMDTFGYGRQAEAEEFCGPVAWYVVKRNGGWQTLCENTRARDIPVMKAQFREMALSAIKRNRVGTLDVAPTFDNKRVDGLKRDALPSHVGLILPTTNGGTQ